MSYLGGQSHRIDSRTRRGLPSSLLAILPHAFPHLESLALSWRLPTIGLRPCLMKREPLRRGLVRCPYHKLFNSFLCLELELEWHEVRNQNHSFAHTR